MPKPAFDIGGRPVGTGRAFLIAEAGVNHNGRMDLARALVDVAVAAHADAVKFQTFRAETLATAGAPKARYQIDTTGRDESQFAMLKRLELSGGAHTQLASYCQERNILFLSTPFDETSADLLDELAVPAFKVSSGDLTNLPLLTHIARKGRPVLLSTGMSTLGEVEGAIAELTSHGAQEIAILHCVSNYPTDPVDCNLRAMATLRTAFGCPVGYSDHTEGAAVSIAAVALGASVIEKHITLSLTMEGPDHRASMEPEPFIKMVKDIRAIEVALGHGRKEPTAAERDMASVARRSLVAARDLVQGSVLQAEWVTLRRPGHGLPPSALDYLVGRRLRCNLPDGHLLQLGDFE